MPAVKLSSLPAGAGDLNQCCGHALSCQDSVWFSFLVFLYRDKEVAGKALISSD